MAQPWAMREMLIEGQGNFGSVEGDPPASMRYTEARLRHLGAALMVDMEKDTVDFVPNYDESRTEPTVFPAAFPNLLVNGGTGIAVGMATVEAAGPADMDDMGDMAGLPLVDEFAAAHHPNPGRFEPGEMVEFAIGELNESADLAGEQAQFVSHFSRSFTGRGRAATGAPQRSAERMNTSQNNCFR